MFIYVHNMQDMLHSSKTETDQLVPSMLCCTTMSFQKRGSKRRQNYTLLPGSEATSAAAVLQPWVIMPVMLPLPPSVFRLLLLCSWNSSWEKGAMGAELFMRDQKGKKEER